MKTHWTNEAIVAALIVPLALAAVLPAGCAGGGGSEQEDQGPAPLDGGGGEDQGPVADAGALDAEVGPGCNRDEQCAGQTPAPGPCEAVACREGACVLVPVREGEPCDDQDACTETSACQDGVCRGSDRVTCPAPPECQEAHGCDPATGRCTYLARPDGTDCDDGNACTGPDACRASVCGGPPVIDGAPCDDGDACTGESACRQGVCRGARPVVCPAPDSCHDGGQCDPVSGACTFATRPDGTPCDDGNACTTQDACQQGRCAGVERSCDDGDPCTSEACHPVDGCLRVASAAPCDDGDACTVGDVCRAGVCQGSELPGCGEAECGDGVCAAEESCAACPEDCSPLGMGTCGEACDPVAADPGCAANMACVPSDGLGLFLQAFSDGQGVCGLGCEEPGDCGAGESCVPVAGLEAAGLCAPACTLPEGAECGPLARCFARGDDASSGVCLPAEACDPGEVEPTACSCEAVEGLATPGLCLAGCWAHDPLACWGASLDCVPRRDPAYRLGTCVGQETPCDPLGGTGCAPGAACRPVGGEALAGQAYLCDRTAGALSEGGDCQEAPHACAAGLLCRAGVCRRLCRPGGDGCAGQVCNELGESLYLPTGTIGLCGPGCGDGWCQGAENCATCPADCGACPAECGDALCVAGENCDTCPEDCGPCSVCGQDGCQADETCESCPGDCGPCPRCGDEVCSGAEDCLSCPDDCGECVARCGDGTCSPVEHCISCPADCGECVESCGDGACTPAEGCDTCPGDCGPCPDRCGDGLCQEEEGCARCPGDCPLLGAVGCGPACDPTAGVASGCPAGSACVPTRLGQLFLDPLLQGQGVCAQGCGADAACGAGQACLLLPGLDAAGLCRVACDPADGGGCPVGEVCLARPHAPASGVCLPSSPCRPGSACDPGGGLSACLALTEGSEQGVCLPGCFAGEDCPPGASCLLRSAPAWHEGRCLGPEAGVACDPLAQTGCGLDQTCLVLGGPGIAGMAAICSGDTGLQQEGEDCLAGGACLPGLICHAGRCTRTCAPAGPVLCPGGPCQDIGGLVGLPSGQLGACTW
ncbi:MAG: hypothetical protein RBU45_15045 [Myxococcota bacterium]|jgi:hypothetical protein|nr:hypothetical protein [Myxococcota bacterium]